MPGPSISELDVASDLARLPPSRPNAASASASSGLRELAQVLLHQQCRALLRLQRRTGSEEDGTVKERQAQVGAELLAQQQSTAKEEKDGPETSAVPRPMAEALEDEGEDVDKDVYLRVLKAQQALPATIRLQEAGVVQQQSATAVGADGSEHQLIRDLERDQLSLDGCLYKPGLGGYVRVVQWLHGAMQTRLQECLPAAAGEDGELDMHALGLEAFAKELLRHINRTHSAGLSYEQLEQIFGVDGVTRIVPDSAAAEPLSIALDVGAFPLPGPAKGKPKKGEQPEQRQPSSPARSPLRSPQRAKEAEAQEGEATNRDWAWGLRARLRTATLYNVHDDAVEQRWLGVRVEFRESLCLPVVVAGGGVGVGGPVTLGASLRMKERAL